MTQSVQEWTRALSSEPLLVMQRTLTQVRDLLRKSSVNHGRLSEVISRDPGFSLHVMRQINNLPNPPKEPISKISLAIPLLGMDAIEQASRTLPSLEEKLKGPPRRGLIDCYSRAVHAAIYASHIAEMQRWQEVDSLYTAALLHDIGEMALWAIAPDDMRSVQRKIIQRTPRESAAQEILGVTLEELNVQLSMKWQLPELVHESQGLSNSHLPKPLSVMLASILARESSLGWQHEKLDNDIELLAEFLEISHEEATAYLHRLAAEAARGLHRLTLPLPAFHLISVGLAAHETETADAAVSPETTRQAPVDTPESSPDAKPSPQPQHATRPETSPSDEKKAVSQPATKKRVNPLQALLNDALQQMHEELGLSRTMFAMLSPDKSALRARFVVESEQQLSLKGFALNMTKPNLFKALMNKPQAISLNRDNAEQYLPMIPQSALEQINNSGFVSMSVFIQGKPVGLFYADNGISGPGVTRRQYDNFKVICQKTVQSISS
ncbi:MAG: HDOD domain-containing protein [Candidatus Thiodiazotropha taylori]|nr:HDOD domain-containing protein [Candidatus Thiodiazotropha taylori]